MKRRESAFTSIYSEGVLWYVRITPVFINMDNLGFPHGLALSSTFKEKKAAIEFADKVDFFLDCMASVIESGDWK